MTTEETQNENHDHQPDSPPDSLEETTPVDVVNNEGEKEAPDVVENDTEVLSSVTNSTPTDSSVPTAGSSPTEENSEQQNPPQHVDTSASASDNDMNDADSIPDENDTPATTPPDPSLRNWSNEKSTRAIAIELKHIETEVRERLEDRDTKRKRKLAGSRRWQELEEDLISWKFSGRVNEDTIQQLQRLVARRNYLFTRLRFLASTRPTWNS